MMFYNSIPIISSEFCMGVWQLDDWTKELMGREWVDELLKHTKLNILGI